LIHERVKVHSAVPTLVQRQRGTIHCCFAAHVWLTWMPQAEQRTYEDVVLAN